MTKALVLSGIGGSGLRGDIVLAKRVNTVGSTADCDLVIQDRLIARRHAEIRLLLERWFVAPTDASTAVFVNGNPVQGQGRVDEGDIVTFGSTSFRARLTEVADQPSERAVGAKPTGMPRLGDYLIRHSYITPSQAQMAAQRQSELERQGRRIQFGDVLYEMGFVTRSQLEQALQEQRGDFLERWRD